METINESKDKIIRIDDNKIEVATDTVTEQFTLTEDDKIEASLALLGEAPPLGERMQTPEELANDDSISEGELKYKAIAALEALQMRAEIIARRSAEQEKADRELRREATKRQRQIDALEKIFLSAQTGRRRLKSAMSQNVAVQLYGRGVRVPGIDESVDEEFTTE